MTKTTEQPNLGYATTRELQEELAARAACGHMHPDYRTAESGGDRRSRLDKIIDIVHERVSKHHRELTLEELINASHFLNAMQRDAHNELVPSKLDDMKAWIANALTTFGAQLAEDINTPERATVARAADDAALALRRLAEVRRHNTKLEERIVEIRNKMRDALNIQGSDGNWNANDYQLGYFNGMELFRALVERDDPKFRSLPRPEDEYAQFRVRLDARKPSRTSADIIREKAEQPFGAQGEAVNEKKPAPFIAGGPHPIKDTHGAECYADGFAAGSRTYDEGFIAGSEDGFKRGYEQHKRDRSIEEANERVFAKANTNMLAVVAEKLNLLERVVENVGKRVKLTYKTDGAEIACDGILNSIGPRAMDEMPSVTVRRVNSTDYDVIPLRCVVDIEKL